jgi:TetR/AcrR family transcriptional regulator
MVTTNHPEISGTRAAILDAAETVFAENGFSGARIDAIAAAAGYNKSLIYQYFGNKLALYEILLAQADREAGELRMRVFAPLLAEPDLATDAEQLRRFLRGAFTAVFDHLLSRPRLLRILMWEMAEGWQTYTQLRIQPDAALDAQLAAVLQRAQRAGVLRHAYHPAIQLSTALQMCQTFLASLPFYQSLAPEADLTSDSAIAEAREYLVNLIVAGLTADPT